MHFEILRKAATNLYLQQPILSCYEMYMSLYFGCIFEHLSEMLCFLETHFQLKFCVFQPFYYLRSMLRCEKDIAQPFLVSLSTASLYS